MNHRTRKAQTNKHGMARAPWSTVGFYERVTTPPPPLASPAATYAKANNELVNGFNRSTESLRAQGFPVRKIKLATSAQTRKQLTHQPSVRDQHPRLALPAPTRRPSISDEKSSSAMRSAATIEVFLEMGLEEREECKGYKTAVEQCGYKTTNSMLTEKVKKLREEELSEKLKKEKAMSDRWLADDDAKLQEEYKQLELSHADAQTLKKEKQKISDQCLARKNVTKKRHNKLVQVFQEELDNFTISQETAHLVKEAEIQLRKESQPSVVISTYASTCQKALQNPFTKVVYFIANKQMTADDMKITSECERLHPGKFVVVRREASTPYLYSVDAVEKDMRARAAIIASSSSASFVSSPAAATVIVVSAPANTTRATPSPISSPTTSVPVSANGLASLHHSVSDSELSNLRTPILVATPTTASANSASATSTSMEHSASSTHIARVNHHSNGVHDADNRPSSPSVESRPDRRQSRVDVGSTSLTSAAFFPHVSVQSRPVPPLSRLRLGARKTRN